MKKILVPFLLLLALLAGSLWFLLRRGPSGAPPSETSETFLVRAADAGTLMQYAEGQTPLRSIRWLPPLADGHLAVQVLTQSDRQRIVLFSAERQVASLLVTRPAGVREGFFNFAELRDAIVLPGDVAVLLYRSADPTSGELPLIMAFDLGSQTLRWVHRAAGERLALAGDSKNGAVFLFGPGNPVLRLPLALQKGEALGTSPFRPSLKPLEMPEEIRPGAVDLLPTGPWAFLLAHAGGLSSYSEGKGWRHWPTPPAAALTFPEARPALARGKALWWQPFPGKLIKVKADGSALDSAEAGALAPPEPWGRDLALLTLRGADPAGNLWFTLAKPAAPSPIATPTAAHTDREGDDSESKKLEEKPQDGDPAVAPSSSVQEDWATYCAQGLERIYRWNPERRIFQMRALPELWSGLTLPPGINRPSGIRDLRPESGNLLFDSGPTAWRLPLEWMFQDSKIPVDKRQVK